MYNAVQCKIQQDFKSRDSGLVISEEFPYLGASPDRVVSYKCCGEGVVESSVHLNIKILPLGKYLMLILCSG